MKPIHLFSRKKFVLLFILIKTAMILYIIMGIFLLSSCTLSASVGIKPQYKIIVQDSNDDDCGRDDDCGKKKRRDHDND
ncbi:MAG: hypothetical protein K2X86_07200 [Cytophagaceae bacterium]|nr:hypothetical protein [Cytophagaceae bacterium]